MTVADTIQPGFGLPSVLRYVVQSTDVLQDMKINVMEENSDIVLWSKERFLTDEEIIEHVVHNPTNTLCWTIHRPAKRGWYIRIRSPTFSPGMFIPLVPVPTRSPHYSEAALSFHSQTNIPTPRPSLSTSGVHSYPPTPPALAAQPPSPSIVRAKLEQIPKDQDRQLKQHTQSISTQITQFILAPHSTQPVHPTSTSFFARALSVLKNSTPSHSNSFTLSRIPSLSPVSSPPPYPAGPSPDAPAHHSISLMFSPPPPLVLTFHDRTPVLTVRCLTGLLEIQKTEEQLLGIDASFWIAVALTYLDFLEDRESYLAALHD